MAIKAGDTHDILEFAGFEQSPDAADSKDGGGAVSQPHHHARFDEGCRVFGGLLLELCDVVLVNGQLK